VPADRLLVDEVAYYNPLTLTWSFELSNGDALTCIPATNHRIYVTLGPPNPTITLFETVAHIGCTNAAGTMTAAAATSAIWLDFPDLVVQRKPFDGFNNPDGYAMTYYANWDCLNYTVPTLLASGDGQCGAWAKLFIETLSAQGIENTLDYVVFFNRVVGDFSYGFVVNNWGFSGPGISGFPDYPYLNIPGTPLVGAASYNWRFSQVSETAGVPGQSNANPASLFNNHQIVKVGGQYYDPSYGIVYLSLGDIDASAIAGYYRQGIWPVDEPDVGLDLNGNGTMTDLAVDTPVYVFQNNPAGNQLVEYPDEWPPP
jgi:hypothetical protein